MGFHLFKKKEVIEDNKEIKNNNDIVEDFGSFAKNSNNKDINISSFERNFKENVSNEMESVSNVNETNIPLNISNNFSTSFNENIDTNFTEDYKNQVETESTNLNTREQYNSNLNEEINNFTSSKQNDITLNINNYDYNPIMSNMESIPNNIKNSQDINVALSNIYNKQDKNDNNENLTTQNTITKEVEIENKTPEPELEPGYKKCPNCGQKMKENYKQCFVCGTMF